MFDPSFTPLAGLEIKLGIVKAKELVAKDRGLFGRKKHSDPFIRILVNGRKVGHTDTIWQTIQPIWEQDFDFNFGAKQATDLWRSKRPLELVILDKDHISFNDPMGTVFLPLDLVQEEAQWYPVEAGNGKYECDNATGEVLVSVQLLARPYVPLDFGSYFGLDKSARFILHFSWSLEGESGIEVACVGIPNDGEVSLSDCVYSGYPYNENRSILYDQRECSFHVNMLSLPRDWAAMYFVLSSTHGDPINDVQVTVVDRATGLGMCRFVQEGLEEASSLVAMRLAKQAEADDWMLTPMGVVDPAAQDFGTLVPQLKAYTRDVLPETNLIDLSGRLCLLRNDVPIRISSYFPTFPNHLTVAFQWDLEPPQPPSDDEKEIGEADSDDEKEEKNDDGDEERVAPEKLDLDASAICFGKSLNVVEIIDFNNVRNNNGSIKHMGDEEDEEVGDDEMIRCYLLEIPEEVHEIAFVLRAKSGENLERIQKLACRLLSPGRRKLKQVGVHSVEKVGSIHGYAAFLAGSFYRSEEEDDEEGWSFRTLDAPVKGENIGEIADEVGLVLEDNRGSTPPELPVLSEEELEDCVVPEAVPVAEGCAAVIPLAEMT